MRLWTVASKASREPAAGVDARLPSATECERQQTESDEQPTADGLGNNRDLDIFKIPFAVFTKGETEFQIGRCA
jgi:hypothetical protein